MITSVCVLNSRSSNKISWTNEKVAEAKQHESEDDKLSLTLHSDKTNVNRITGKLMIRPFERTSLSERTPTINEANI